MAKKKAPKPKRRHVRLRVIPEPAQGTRSVLVYTGEGTVVMRGTWGNVTMDCGKCGSPLIVGMKTAAFTNVVLKCHKCGAYNETLA